MTAKILTTRKNLTKISEKDKILIPAKKPRNFFVPLSKNRKAGKHVDKRKKEAYDPKHRNKQDD